LFLIDALRTLGASYAFYFSSLLCFSLSLPIAAARSYQVLYGKTLNKSALIAAEILVELLRIVQYLLFIAYGTDTPFRSLFSADAWEAIFGGIRKLEGATLLWDLLGFMIVFGLYNAVLFAILRPSVVQKMTDRAGIGRFAVSAVRNAVMLAYKNLFLIPVSMIYLFLILNMM
jgi:hypothetical protein